MKKFNIVKKDFYFLGRYFNANSAYGEYMHNNRRFIWHISDFTPIKKTVQFYDCENNCTVTKTYTNYKISVLEVENCVNLELMNIAKVFTMHDWIDTSTGYKDLRDLEKFITPLIVRNNLQNTKCNTYVNWAKLQSNEEGALLRPHVQKQRHKVTVGTVAMSL